MNILNKTYFYYFFSEILSTFLLGVVIFVSLISMVQFLQITEFILIHNVPVSEVLSIIFYMSISFLPTIFPMSLLFSVLLTYTRLSSDSEIIAFQSFGYSILHLILPSVIFSVFIFVISYQTLDAIGPNSRKKFDDTIQRIGGQKIISNLQARTFAEDLFNFTLYFNEKIDSKNFKDVFIKDNRDPKHPLVIVAKYGQIQTNNDKVSQSLNLQLTDGMATEQTKSGTNIKFQKYTIALSAPIRKLMESRDLNTFTIADISFILKDKKLTDSHKYGFSLEIHRRLSIAFSCLIFGVLGATLGISTNRRTTSSKGFILSVICLTIYWTLVAATTTLANSSLKTPYLLWFPNFLFLIFTIFTLFRLERR